MTRVPRAASAAFDDDLLGDGGDRLLVAPRLVGLQHRELRGVRGVDALVAEDPSDLVDAVRAAHHGPLQEQLEGDAHGHVDVERVQVGAERPGRRAAVHQLQHRRLQLEVAVGRAASPGCCASRAPACAPCRVPPGGRRGRRSAAGRGSPRRVPCAGSGSGRSALLASCQAVASTESSPRLDEITRPVTDTKSPRSMSVFQASSRSSPISASDSITCSRTPESAGVNPSWMVAKHSLPVLRTRTTRPLTDTTSVVSSPAVRCPQACMDGSRAVRPRHCDRVGRDPFGQQPGALLVAHLLLLGEGRGRGALLGHRIRLATRARPPAPVPPRLPAPETCPCSRNSGSKRGFRQRTQGGGGRERERQPTGRCSPHQVRMWSNLALRWCGVPARESSWFSPGKTSSAVSTPRCLSSV